MAGAEQLEHIDQDRQFNDIPLLPPSDELALPSEIIDPKSEIKPSQTLDSSEHLEVLNAARLRALDIVNEHEGTPQFKTVTANGSQPVTTPDSRFKPVSASANGNDGHSLEVKPITSKPYTNRSSWGDHSPQEIQARLQDN